MPAKPEPGKRGRPISEAAIGAAVVTTSSQDGTAEKAPVDDGAANVSNHAAGDVEAVFQPISADDKGGPFRGAASGLIRLRGRSAGEV